MTLRSLQIDNGVPWTDTRKFFIIVPVLLCVCAACAPLCVRPCRQLVAAPSTLLQRQLSVAGPRRPCACRTASPSRPSAPRALPAPHPRGRRFLVTCYAVDWELQHVFVNSVMLAVLIIAKLPELHGIRIFGINSARVD
jgi:hypothetical protein